MEQAESYFDCVSISPSTLYFTLYTESTFFKCTQPIIIFPAMCSVEGKMKHHTKSPEICSDLACLIEINSHYLNSYKYMHAHTASNVANMLESFLYCTFFQAVEIKLLLGSGRAFWHVFNCKYTPKHLESRDNEN